MDCTECRDYLSIPFLFMINPDKNNECAKHVLECEDCYRWIHELTEDTIKKQSNTEENKNVLRSFFNPLNKKFKEE